MKKALRVTDNKEFQRIIHSSRFYTNGSFAVYYSPKQLAKGRVGISVSKKRGNAVVRNRIKRQVRMMAAELIDFDGKYDFIIIIRSRYAVDDYQTSKKALNDILEKVYNNK